MECKSVNAYAMHVEYLFKHGKYLMAQWLNRASHVHEICSHGLEVMG